MSEHDRHDHGNEIHVEGRACAEVKPWNLAFIVLFRFALHAAVVLAFARWHAAPGSWLAATLMFLFVLPGIERFLSPTFYRLGLWSLATEESSPTARGPWPVLVLPDPVASRVAYAASDKAGELHHFPVIPRVGDRVTYGKHACREVTRVHINEAVAGLDHAAAVLVKADTECSACEEEVPS